MIIHDMLCMEINGALCADNTLLDAWTDSDGTRHVAGESLLSAETDPEFDFESARVACNRLTISIIRGASGKRSTFDGKVSRAGMRGAVGDASTVTFQIDEIIPEPPLRPCPF